MLILSHRGYHARAPENTLEAFEHAIALGVDGIETDVRICSDGTPIIFHNRHAPNGQDISSMSRSELEAIMGYPVPTLENALECCSGVLWNLEIKTPSALDATLAIVSRFFSIRRFLITSFWHPVVEEFNRRLDVDCGLLVAHRPLDSLNVADWLAGNPRLKAIVWDYETADGELLQRTASLGLRNFIYGPITMAEHNQLIQWKVDGVITDHPEFLLKARRELRNIEHAL